MQVRVKGARWYFVFLNLLQWGAYLVLTGGTNSNLLIVFIMRIKQWALALLLGGFVLSAASCSSKKDEPKKPDTSKTETASLEGTWTLSGVTFSPESVKVDEKDYKVADHIFQSFIFGGLNTTPSKVKIEGEKATLISVVNGAEKTFALTLKDGKLFFQAFSLGRITSEGSQIKLEILVANDLLKRMPVSHFDKNEAGTILTAIAEQGKDLKITAVGTK